jgi:hypothetical protein
VEYVGGQVKVASAALEEYPWSGRSIKYHREQVRAAFGFREFSRGDEDKLAGWLAEEVCPVELRDPQLREAVLVHCRAERIEPPGRVDRIIGSARAVFEQRFCDRTLSRLDQVCVEALERLIADEGTGAVPGRAEQVLRRFTRGGPNNPPTPRSKSSGARCARSSPVTTSPGPSCAGRSMAGCRWRRTGTRATP